MPADPETPWGAVDRYILEHCGPDDPLVADGLRRAASEGLPTIQLSPPQARLLFLLVKAVEARRALEIGTLGGYSATAIARALPPGGRLISLEIDAHHADVARQNLAHAGLLDRVDVRVGPALESLQRLADERTVPFDVVFIDADRVHYAEYLDWAVRLARPGALVLVDNVVKGGAILDDRPTDPQLLGLRRFYERLGRHPGVETIAIQTVGSKGHDGFALGVVRAHPTVP